MKCRNCKARCAWAGTEHSEHGKCFIGYTPITNADRIRAMTDEELADELLSLFAAFYAVEWSSEAVLDWLKEEAKT